MNAKQSCYGPLRQLQDDGYIAAYISSQNPRTGRWGFKVTMLNDDVFWFLPRETLAFVEGMKIGVMLGEATREEAEAEEHEERVALEIVRDGPA